MDRRGEVALSSRRTVTVLLAAIVALAAAVRFWGLSFGLPHTNTRPDETIVIDVALKFLQGNLAPVFYDYPWLYMWVLSGLYLLYGAWGFATGAFHSIAGLLASWRVNWTPFFLIPRAMSALLGTATVVVVFRLARRLWDDTTGLVAALFMALAFLHVRDSHFATTDVAMTFLVMLSVSLLIDAHRSKRTRDFVVSGIVGGLAAATKYNALLLIVPLTASYLLNIVEEPDRRKAMQDPRLFVYGIPFLMAFAVGVPFLAFDLPNVLSQMTLLRQSMEVGTGELNMSAGWIHHLQYSLRYGLGWPLLAASLGGILAVVVLDSRIGLLLLSFPIAYFLVAGSIRNLFFRYALPLVPFLCLTAARLVTWLVDAILAKGKWQKPSVASAAVTAAVAGALVLPSAVSVVQFNRIASRTDNRVVVARWFDEHVPPGSSVLMSGSSYGYVQFTRAKDYKAWVWDRQRLIFVTDLDRRPGVGQPDWILLQESPLPSETQQAVTDFLKSGYAFVEYFPAFSASEPHVFDLQDAFFIPFAGFHGVERPGPNYTLYKRNRSAE
jgi:Dolichyl-phosphate-mannose-protein mannosyltransferase